MAEETLEPTLQNVLDQKSLKWIFCGGKGGVGKTTTSCSLAIQLAKVRESVLLISTDPAHNLSDAFGQKFSKDATKIDPTSSIQEMVEQSEDNGMMGSMMQDLAFAIPGVDEAMGFAEIMKYNLPFYPYACTVKSIEFSVIVFDTAPTGHTLRFLSFPSVLEKALGKLSTLGTRFGPMISQMSNMMGAGAGSQEDMFAKLESMRATITDVNTQFKNPELTTFVCKGSNCEHCGVRRSMQQKYLNEAHELYDDFFHIIQLPLLTEEVRGPEKLTKFSEMLVTPSFGVSICSRSLNPKVR
ncbi:arsenical pump-driving ATPase [Flagelloscypha sp. PMI_526]|nr:arsenical pump-driving ATPase [Flagelloscypha sp. PMI_526]